MPNDPIVQEVHQIRQQLLDECGRDFDAYVKSIQARAARHAHHHLTAEELADMKRPATPTPVSTEAGIHKSP